jgi:hypothetical protein
MRMRHQHSLRREKILLLPDTAPLDQAKAPMRSNEQARSPVRDGYDGVYGSCRPHLGCRSCSQQAHVFTIGQDTGERLHCQDKPLADGALKLRRSRGS